MATIAYFKRPKMLQRLDAGPLGIHIDLFAARLLEDGHCQQSAWRNLRVVSDFSHWLARRQLNVDDLDERVVNRYQQFRARYRFPFSSDRPTLIRLLCVLREIDVIAPHGRLVESHLCRSSIEKP